MECERHAVLASVVQKYGHMYYHFLEETLPRWVWLRCWLSRAVWDSRRGYRGSFLVQHGGWGWAAAALLTRGWSVTSGSWHLSPTAALVDEWVQEVPLPESQGACPLPCPCRRVALLLKAGLPPDAKLMTWGQPYEYEVRSGCCTGEASTMCGRASCACSEQTPGRAQNMMSPTFAPVSLGSPAPSSCLLQYLQLLGIPPERVVAYDPTRIYCADTLLLPTPTPRITPPREALLAAREALGVRTLPQVGRCC